MRVNKTEFKAKALEYLRHVENSGEPLVVTDHGQPTISSISAWEVAMLVAHGRLALTMAVDDWLDTVARIEGVRFIAVDHQVAVASSQLPEPFPNDPADRIIVALARQLNAPLVTADSKLQQYPHIHTLW